MLKSTAFSKLTKTKHDAIEAANIAEGSAAQKATSNGKGNKSN